MELSLERQLEICNAINALTAKGYKIYTEGHIFDGAAMVDGGFVVLDTTKREWIGGWSISFGDKITAVDIKAVATIYDPAEAKRGK